MTAIQLYKFMCTTSIEWHFGKNNNREDVVMFVWISDIGKFHDIMSKTFLTDNELKCVMKDGYFAIWMNDICEYSDIDMDEIFEKDKEK